MNKRIIMVVGVTAIMMGTTLMDSRAIKEEAKLKQNVVIAAAAETKVQQPVEPLTATLSTNKTIQVKKRSYIENVIFEASRNNMLPEGLVMAVIQAESDFNPNCIGPDTEFGNAHGLMQLLPSTAKEVGVTNILDPEQNIQGGTKYLKMMIDRYSDKDYFDQNGNLLTPWEMGVMAYNWGYPNLDKHMAKNGGKVVIAKNSKYAIPAETYGYLMKIKSNYDFNYYYD